MVDWISLAIPFAYLAVLVGSLATFSFLYRKRKQAKAASLAPWFPQHLQRDIYLSLLHLEPEGGSPKVPESILKAALLRRATEDIRRLIQIRNGKQALSTLLQRGSVGDDLWQRFLRAEKEVEEELRDVVNEANAFAPGWGQIIFQSAGEMAQNAMIRQSVQELQAQAPTEKEWWERKKANIQSEFMKELEDEAANANSTPKALNATPAVAPDSDQDVAVKGSGVTTTSQQGGGRKKKKGKH